MANFCKRVSELRSLEDIGVNSGVRSLLRNVSIEDMVLAARIGELDNFLKNKVEPDYVMSCYLEIQNTLSKAGYLRKDFYGYLESFNWLSFMKAAVDGCYDGSLFDGASNIKRVVRGMTNEQYEDFDGLSVLQIKSLNNILKRCISCNMSYQIVLIRFGLTSDGHNRTREDIADILSEDISYIEDLEIEAIQKFGTVTDPIINEILS